jgi:hypothetical protein
MSKCADSCGTPVSYEGAVCAVCSSIRSHRETEVNLRPVVISVLLFTAAAVGAAFLWAASIPSPR